LIHGFTQKYVAALEVATTVEYQTKVSEMLRGLGFEVDTLWSQDLVCAARAAEFRR